MAKPKPVHQLFNLTDYHLKMVQSYLLTLKDHKGVSDIQAAEIIDIFDCVKSAQVAFDNFKIDFVEK
jgi:hypothetical protein